MKRLLLAIVSVWTLAGVSSPAPALTVVHLWSQGFGGVSNDDGNSVAVDGAGNVLVTGSFAFTANFGGSDLTSMGSSDIFVAKYNAAGVHQWSQRFGGTLNDYGLSVAVDGSGVLVTGSFEGTVNFGGSDLTSAGGSDIFVAKYNAAGVHQWSQRFGNTGSDVGYSVAVDGSGNVLVTGHFNGTVNFGGSDLASMGSRDIFVAKYNAAGVHQWSQRFGGGEGDVGYSVAVDGSGNVLVTGNFAFTVNFGGNDLTGISDIFVAKFNAAGVHQWSQRFGGALDDYGHSVAVDGAGNVLVTGLFQGTAYFGGSGLSSAGGLDIFVAKYNAAGVHQWSQRFGGTGTDVGYSVAVDGSGNVLVTGSFAGIVNFGGSDLTSAGSFDVFVAKYNAAGVHHASQRFGGASTDEGNSVAVDGPWNVLVTGNFAGTANFGGSDLTSVNGSIFVAKYAIDASGPVISAITDIGNDQGRQVRIEFSRAGDDVALGSVIQYEAYRRNDAVTSPAAATPAGAFSQAQLLEQGWVYAGDVPAHGTDVYLMDAPSDGDSTVTLGQHYSAFFIRAATADPLTYYDSPVDSGYSLDNLAPGIPGGLAYSAGVLSWKKSAAGDFDHFSIYGANTTSFATATLVDYCVAPTMDVNASPYVFYFVTATDFSGNEGKPAVVNAQTGIGGTPKSFVLSISAYPNPFNPTTTIRYTVPSKGRAVVEIYDARGAHIATLVDTEKAAGAYTQGWDGRDDAGRAVSSGVYFARLTHPSGTKTYKMVLLK